MLGPLLLILASEVVAPKPMTDPSTWVTSDDYPKSEIGRGATGVTVFTLLVSKYGDVEDCRIQGSSGSVALDATACALIKIRARFTPGRDGSGKKIAALYRSRVRWQMPNGVNMPIPAGPQILSIAVNFSVAGVVESCTVVEGQDNLRVDAMTPCVQFPVGLKRRPFADAAGTARAVRMIMRQTVEIKPQ